MLPQQLMDKKIMKTNQKGGGKVKALIDVRGDAIVTGHAFHGRVANEFSRTNWNQRR